MTNYILFIFDVIYNSQTYVAGSHDEESLMQRIENMDQTKYYSIYRYKEKTFHFCGKLKADTYTLLRTIKGNKNSGIFPYSPLEFAHTFEDAYAWYYTAQ